MAASSPTSYPWSGSLGHVTVFIGQVSEFLAFRELLIHQNLRDVWELLAVASLDGMAKHLPWQN